MDQIVIKDQIAARNEKSSIVMDWQTGVPCTARQLIAERVRIEYERLCADRILPSAAYRHLVDLPEVRQWELDEAQQSAVLHEIQQRALAGFIGNAFLLLVNDEQITELDSEFSVGPDSDVTFVRLLPLKGG